MAKLRRHKEFLKDYATVRLTDTQFEKLISFLNHLKEEIKLPPEAKDHALKGDWKGFRECHLGGDTLLVYTIDSDTIILARIGTHSQLFG
ncbi:MAG: type II toxin-antitoxin system YafQ family toxin [Sulfuricurvum sp.]|nr:type II toxin-antitoxin system YafQ family toxin [Sulfuricurvum sp.]